MIKIQNLKKKLPHFELDVNLEIKEGEIFGVVGKSGSGKSTLLKIIQGITKSDSGKIEFKDNRESEMSYIFQEFNLLYNKNVFENVGLPFKLKRMKIKDLKYREKILGVLKFVGLEHKKDSYISELSGGEKQRVAIARALVTNPKILLCDEVTTSLDNIVKDEILELFLKINKDYKTTILIVSHELDVIKKVCDRVAVMENGKISDVFPIKKDKIVNTKENYLNYVKGVL